VGIREVSKAAVIAREATEAAELEKRRAMNRTAALVLVEDLLGITSESEMVRVVRAGDYKEDNLRGYGSVVELNIDGDIVYLKINRHILRRDPYMGTLEYQMYFTWVEGNSPYRPIAVNKEMSDYTYSVWSADCVRIRSLADLGDIIMSYDKQCELLENKYGIEINRVI
jgi:hypothetical protein